MWAHDMAVDGLAVSLKAAGPIPLDVGFVCAAGEALALVGPSGSGKSTILRAIAGLHRPTHGRVTVKGAVWLDTAQMIDVPPHRRRTGLVFQSYALFPHMTALGNVRAALGHLPREARGPRARDLLSLVHLSGLEERKPADLSGGQRQRVAVARALARDPDVLLLDEPFSAVDKVTRRKLHDELRELGRAFRIPTIFVTHDFDEAAVVANRMCLIDRGTLLQTGAPWDILARPVSDQAARLVDVRNLFEAWIAGHEGCRTWLDWNGRRIETSRADAFAVGACVAWSIPGSQVLLSGTDPGQPDTTPNRFSASVRHFAQLSESISLSVVLEGADAPVLAMTLPAHDARRTALGVGAAVTISLMPDGIHLMNRSGVR